MGNNQGFRLSANFPMFCRIHVLFEKVPSTLGAKDCPHNCLLVAVLPDEVN